MIFSFEPFSPKHLIAVQENIQDHQMILRDENLVGAYERIANMPGMSWTGTLDGRPVGCAGVRYKWAGSGVAWAIISQDVPKLGWHRICTLSRQVIQRAHAMGLSRIECHVRKDFKGGRAFAEILDFKIEGEHHLYGPDGGDYISYARFAEDQVFLGR